MLNIKDLQVEIEEQEILKGIDLEVKAGEIHAIMGPNGAGKSTLGKVLAGDPSYQVQSGSVTLEGCDLLELEPEERARKGLFLGFQYPIEIPGVSNLQFYHAAYKSVKEKVSEEEIVKLLEEKCKLLGFSMEFLSRGVNEGFSGGEKKRNEIVQMALLDPKCAILDETDSGLDIDALRIIAEGIQKIHNKEKGLVLITHYQRLLESIRPDVVHVMIDGKIAISGGYDLAVKLEEQGYDWLTGRVCVEA